MHKEWNADFRKYMFCNTKEGRHSCRTCWNVDIMKCHFMTYIQRCFMSHSWTTNLSGRLWKCGGVRLMTNCSLKYLSSWILLTSYGFSRNSKWYSYGTKMAGDAAQMANMEDSSSIVLDNERLPQRKLSATCYTGDQTDTRSKPPQDHVGHEAIF